MLHSVTGTFHMKHIMFFLQMSSEEKNTQVCQKKQNQVFQYAYH